MYFFIILVIMFLLVTFLMAFYVFKRLNRIIPAKANSKKVSWIINISLLLLLIVFLYVDAVNTVVVCWHFYAVLLVFDLIYYVVRKIIKKEGGYIIYFILTIGVTTVYLGCAYYLAHHVVQTEYTVHTDKDIGVDNYRIAQITDSHIGSTFDGDDFIRYMEMVNASNPDIVAVTGDFIDDDTTYEDMVKACKGLGNLRTKDGVYFVFGNHDKGYYNNRGYDEHDLRKELADNNVIVLEDEIVELSDNIVLIGRQDAQTRDRADAISLTENIDKSKFIIVLDHEPNDYVNEEKAEMDMVLLGHTHGGQLFPVGPITFIAGANDQTYGLEQRGGTTFIVSSGISDWAIKFKTCTVAEYVVIDII